jgi:hypothetical protein
MTIKGQSKYFFSPKKSLVFSLIFFVLQIAMSGTSIEAIFVLIVLLPMATLVFLAWRNGTQVEIVLNISFRTILLGLLIFLLWVFFIKTAGGGQLGYADALQVHDNLITPLGYRRIMSSAMITAATAWIAATIAAFFQVTRIPRY